MLADLASEEMRHVESLSAKLCEPEGAESYRYELFGLRFDSAERIPGLPHSLSRDVGGAVELVFGDVPGAIADAEYCDDTVQASSSEYLFSYPGVLKLYVVDDARIVVERLADCDPIRMLSVIFGIGSSIIGLRRGFIPLHASAVRYGDACVAMAGQSGQGKSTFAAALVNLGFNLHADDLCLAQPLPDKCPQVGAGVREVKLTEEAASTLGWNDRTPFADVPHASKSLYRLAQTPTPPLPLRRIYALEFSDGESVIERVEGVDALQILIGGLRLRPGLLSVGDKRRTFESLASISRTVEIYRFVRPRDTSRIRYYADRFADHVADMRSLNDL